MRHEEILHRFFDDGLDEALEDALFSTMAADSELRGQFVEHLKLHSMIQEDISTITTPAHVTQKLFTDLGLNAPQGASMQSGSAWTRRAAVAAASIGAWLLQSRGYILTAAAAAGITALVFVYAVDSGDGTAVHSEAHTERMLTPSQDRTVNPSAPDVFEPGSSERTVSRVQLPGSMPAPGSQDVFTTSARRTARLGSTPGSVTSASAATAMNPGLTAVLPSEGITSTAIAEVALPQGIALGSSGTEEVESPAFSTMTPSPVEISQTGIIMPWHFFRPTNGSSILSNLVVELRKHYSNSYPEVNLPHNSHKVFENMALNVVYKTTDHHAFGFEYGREDFGQIYHRTIPVQQFRTQDPNLVQVGVPDETSTIAEFQERRMLDVFGAVWKLSLPEYGILGMVYPYMRTFVGASKQGPLGKVRVGLEMYPSNFSMFNVGIEGGMLRYSVEQTSYYSAKLNYSFGVALGF